ncbi:MAG: hypothetical protein WEB53_02325 [Akkermansiaceae bacterium]
MSNLPNSWFHCGRCGSLFLSVAGDLDNRTCPECGRNPSLGLEAAPPPPRSQPQAPSTAPPERKKRATRKRKRSYFIYKLVLACTAVLILIAVGASKLFHREKPERKIEDTSVLLENETRAANIAFQNEVSPLCNLVFSQFLAAGTPEKRNQFVLAPITTASKMARFYSLNPLTNIDPSTLSLADSAVINLPNGRALETLWNTGEGRQLDAVFAQEDGEWRIDWDHFVRYSDFPWALFLAGSGEPVGEFRLLARERLAEERKGAETVSIVLYAPRFGSLIETGYQSPEFLIPRASENGRLLDAAFKLEREGKRPFGVQLPNANPEKLIQVRVKVRRIEDELERRFELEQVIACHWYSVDEPGVEIPNP